MVVLKHNFSPSLPIINEGKRVLGLESKALDLLSDALDEAFSKAVDLIDQTKGRVIVTGMGKSGHIGRKIAATFASTGIPAFFVHPAEASHGDLGVIDRDDCLIALSNSGETRELSDLIHFANRFGVPLIAITSNRESSLSQNAQLSLVLPKIEEACTLDLVPTTSTTMMIALGDALAVALLKLKGFTSADFGNFHPGGKLGQRLKFVKSYMHTPEELPLVSKGILMRTALPIMTEKTFGCVGVIDETGLLLGVITDGDVRRHVCDQFMTQCVEEVMTVDPKVTYPDMLAVEALALMNEKRITNLFVLESPHHKKPVGIIHVHDCLEAGMA